MVESIEELCQLERVFGQVCRFRGGDALVDYVDVLEAASHSSQISVAFSPAR